MAVVPATRRREGPPAVPDGRRPYAGETYYGQPALKPSPWNWMVSGYIYLAGLCGAAQGIAAIARLRDRHAFRGVVRNARYLAFLGSAAGAVLLIADLRTPQRWYNMLRILRPTSPMSLGTYILGAFGAFSGVAVLGELLRGRGRLGGAAERAADVAQIGAAVSGAGAGTYTAALLASTSTPYWAAAPRHLGVLFATSSVATAAALSLGERLGGRPDSSRRLDDVAALATAAHLAVSLAADRYRRARGIPAELHEGASGRMTRTGDLVFAGALPLAAYGLNRAVGNRSAGLSIAGSLALLAGGYMARHGTLKLGMDSAKVPEAYFRFAQPENLPRACQGTLRWDGTDRERLRDGRHGP